MAALASEILTANRVLSRRMEKGAHSLISNCTFVSELSIQLLRLIRTAEQRAAVGDLAFRVVSAAGAAVLDSGSLGYHQVLSARSGVDLPTRGLITSQLLYGIRSLVELLHELSTEQPQAFAVLRNTTAKPAAVIIALKHIRWSKLGKTGQSGEEISLTTYRIPRNLSGGCLLPASCSFTPPSA